MAARSMALVTNGATANAAYRTAIAHLQRSPVAVHLARTHLV